MIQKTKRIIRAAITVTYDEIEAVVEMLIQDGFTDISASNKMAADVLACDTIIHLQPSELWTVYARKALPFPMNTPPGRPSQSSADELLNSHEPDWFRSFVRRHTHF